MEKSISMTRGVKFWGLKFTREFIEDYHKTVFILNKISSALRAGLVSGEIVKMDRHNIYTKDGKEHSTAAYNKEFLSHLYDVDRKWDLKRSLLTYIIERFLSYKKRNKNKKIPNISIKLNKSFYYKESTYIEVDLANKKLIVTTLYGKHEIKYSHSIKTEYLTISKRSKKMTVGGNFVMNQNAFIAAIVIQKDIAYEPNSVLSFDLNKKKEDWIVFNNGTKIPQPKNIESKLKEIEELNIPLADKNKPVKERKFKSKQRNKIRRQLSKKQSELNKLIQPIAIDIVNEAIKTQSLLCIDSVATGAMSGTFGQCKIIPALVKLCQNKGVPFYVVPCAYTSRRCLKCGDTSKKNRKSTEKFECKACGYKTDAQINGALNIAYQGAKLLDAGVPYDNWGKRNSKVDTLIKQYSQQKILVDNSSES